MRLVSTSWRDAVRYARVGVRPGGERFIVPDDEEEDNSVAAEGPEVPDAKILDVKDVKGAPPVPQGDEKAFLHRVTTVDLNSRHVTWVLAKSQAHLVAPFISTSTESLVMDNVQKPDVLGALLARKSVELRNLQLLSLQKSSISDADLAQAVGFLPNLRTLDVTGSMFLRGDFLNALSGMPHLCTLERLRMGGCGLHVESYRSAWAGVMARARRLEELVVHGNVLGDEEVRCLRDVKGTLRYLDVRRCSDLTFDGVYFVARELRLETLKLGPVFGVDARRGVEEVWDVLSRHYNEGGKGSDRVEGVDYDGDDERGPLRNLEVFGMEDGGVDSDARNRRMSHGLRMVSFMDTNVCWQRLRDLRNVEYLNVSRSLPVSIHPSQSNEFYSAGISHVIAVSGLEFPRLKTFKASNSSLPWPVVRAVLEGAPRLAVVDLGGWEGLKASRLTSSTTHGEMMEGFSDVLCGLRHLETLRLQGTHLVDGHVRKFFSSLGSRSGLRVLDLSRNPDVDLSLGSEGLAGLAGLEVLCISNTGIQVVSDGNIEGENNARLSLRELVVSGGNFRHATAMGSFLRILRRAPDIRVLHITDVHELTDAALASILDGRHSLDDLNISGCASLTPKGLEPLANLEKLTKLDVSRLRQAVTDDSLAAVLSRHTLTELRASGADLTPASLDALLQSKMLHYVDLSFCFGLGDDEQCGNVVRESGSPIKIRLPRGSARLGLFSERRDDAEEDPRVERHRVDTGARAGRRLAFE